LRGEGQCAADASDEGRCAFSLPVARESSHESEKKEFAKRGEPKWVYATDAGVDLLRFTRHGPWAAHPHTARKGPRR